MSLIKSILDMSEVKRYLENSLKEYFKKAGKDKAIVGVSGGKDSAIVLAICCSALGPENVIAAKLFNSDNQRSRDVVDADEVIRLCGIPNENIYNFDIQGILYTMKTNLEVDYTSETAINIAPRVRMTYLRALTQKNNGLLVGTGNLSEAIVGYYTKDGDGSWDINPIGNLTSVEVVQLGHLYKNLSTYIVEKTPDDGLSGKSDEEKLGISYELIHKFIREYAENIEVVNDISKEKYPQMFRYIYDLNTEKIYLAKRKDVRTKLTTNASPYPTYSYMSPAYGSYCTTPESDIKIEFEEVTTPIIQDLIPIMKKMVAAKHKNGGMYYDLLHRKNVISIRDLLYHRSERDVNFDVWSDDDED